jgi:hypothetical protein
MPVLALSYVRKYHLQAMGHLAAPMLMPQLMITTTISHRKLPQPGPSTSLATTQQELVSALESRGARESTMPTQLVRVWYAAARDQMYMNRLSHLRQAPTHHLTWIGLQSIIQTVRLSYYSTAINHCSTLSLIMPVPLRPYFAT